MDNPLHIGIDLGTSGVRACAIDGTGGIHAWASAPLPHSSGEGAAREQNPADWWRAVTQVLGEITGKLPATRIASLAVDGTSGTVLLTDAGGTPLSPGLMYNDARATAEAATIARHAPAESAAHGTASGVAKWLWLERHTDTADARWVLNQADWIVGKLTGRWGVSDENNVLKLGWDPVARRWPDWLATLDLPLDRLPTPYEPGIPLGELRSELADHLALSSTATIHAGTTDSTAALLATGCAEPGDAMTALGSTLVVKILSERPVFAPKMGVYSHRLGDRWLVGGGSNSGGAVLEHFFDAQRMNALTPRLRPDHPTGLDYYPLLTPGERFPLNDPHLPPRLEPRPEDDAEFFQGLLEGIATIEARAYRMLVELGATPPRSIRTTGGGAANPAWSRIRERLLGAPLIDPVSPEAAYGTALLARPGE